MSDALRYEWARIRTIRSTWWLTGSALAVALLISVLLGWVGHHDFSRNGASADDVEGFGPFLVTQFAASGQVPSLVGFLVAMIGIFAWGHEYRHGMIRASLTALNSRQALWTRSGSATSISPSPTERSPTRCASARRDRKSVV